MPARPDRAALPLRPHRAAIVFASLATAAAAAAQPFPVEGFLCCNMLSDGSWVSDINYADASKQLLAAGTPLKVTGHGRWRLLVEIDGKALAIGNDYSRTMTLEQFQQRYVLADDPRRKLAAFSPKVREAIKSRKVARGMTREQVLMAVGYPITSYTADLDAPLWRYWLSRSEEYQVFWNDAGRVERLFGTPEVRAKVWLD